DLSSNIYKIMGNNTSSDYTPMWASCTVSHNGTDWYQVGVRFKGNSSLSQTYSSGNRKLSLKLDFDQYEDSYPALTNQRFYGFKQLNLNNNYNDESLMREKAGTDLFRDFGLAAAHTSFCAVYINDDYYGVYTIVEEVDDTVIKTQFEQSTGNLYKPEETAGRFSSGSYDTDELGLKTNTLSPNYSDVKELYNAINSSTRSSDEQAWKDRLEAVFDVDGFLKWLAGNTAIQNWDSYGNMAHNYYLYNNPDTDLLTWIPWDHNESLQNATGNYKTFTPTQLSSSSYTGSSWPLIYYLMNIDEYQEIYYEYLDEFVYGVFEPTRMIAIYNTYYELLKDYAYAEEDGRTFLSDDSDFDDAVSTLKTHVMVRYNVMVGYLD
ncbi:MAG: CotH kinase family protein, partial [Rikenellaceae bacterium]